MTMGDFLNFFCPSGSSVESGKVPSFQLLETQVMQAKNQTKIKDPSVVESTVGHVFVTG